MKDELIKIALNAAVDASDVIMAIYEKGFTIDRKSDKSPVTDADKKANELIVSYLSKTGIPLITEESALASFDERKKYSRVWIVDPLDGTKEFIKGSGEFTVNIALIENGQPVFGVITQPVKHLLWAGVLSRGLFVASFEDRSAVGFPKFIMPKPSVHERKRVLASRSHLTSETAMYIKELEGKYGTLDLLNAGSSLKLALIAEGEADIYPRFGPTMEWDIAAGHALLKAVGKNVLSFPGNSELTYNKPDLHNPWFIAE